ncbi:MAG TPA: DUF4175 family protein [Paracoccus sp. (in: a-proteobacteria)]|uniref:DUF4175 domain-containing protein n=1 Tax=Paracoccus sp. TaxID=267 RepID=UPI002BACAA61|nr:DUF4175 family protein [Paracoccus sp. (in: a-proteobacteria)]HWL56641.1 DUF4175 family protein [Paracoccus sp. (in: a-proteobacteria)]
MKRPDLPRVRRAVGLTRAGMWWEAVAGAFWPLGVVLALSLAALAFGGAELLSSRALLWIGLAALLATVIAALWGIRRFRRPSIEQARARVDRTLPSRPLTALRDDVAIGRDDAGSEALWQAHLARMESEAASARAVIPDARLRWLDPVGLRLVGLVALAMTLVFAPSGQLGLGIAALGATFRPAPDARPDPGAGPGWEGWAEPPAYTRRPTIYLNALPEGQELELPQGSKLSFRIYGEGAALSQTIGRDLPEGEAAAPEFSADHDGLIEIAGRQFPVIVIPDAPPSVERVVAPDRRADGRFIQPFAAADDNGVTGGKARIALNMGAIDRRFGLTIPPEPRETLEIELPLPATGSRKALRGQLTTDLSRHPWANLPVTVSLEVTDGIDQKGSSPPVAMILPGRRFFDPLAAALIEIRRDLLWSRENGPRSAQILRTISWQPDGFMDPDLAQGLKGAIGTLEGGPLTDEARNKLAQVLWDAAVALEDGGLADALERMQQAQERLSEAIRNGASPDEVQRLMDELREATDAYTDMLAQQGRDPSERFDRSPQQGQRITGDQIQQMMDEIQRLMNEGRMAEAQQLLEQFNRMMQNMRVTQGQGGEGGRQRPMDQLAETLREQQDLADEAMREMQDQYGQWQQPGGQQGQQGEQQGQQGEGQQDGGSLADRQRSLREDLGRQRGLLPGRGTAEGDQARRNLDDAGRAMEEAEQALRDGDQAGAMERQAQAIQNMREGMRALGDMMARNQQNGQQGEPQPGGQQGGPEGPEGERNGQRGLAEAFRRQPPMDPLGRSTAGNGGQLSTGEPLAEGPDPARRARDLQDEIRRRSGERERPRDERDYLGRLLDDF